MVKMQGATMTQTYKSAAELMEKEYNVAFEKAKQGDDSGENKEAVKEEKELAEKKKAVKGKTSVAKEEAKGEAGKAAVKAGGAKSSGTVVCLVN